MTADQHKEAVKELMTIPCMHRTLADELVVVGITQVCQLKGKVPERLFLRVPHLTRKGKDRQLLYVLRCAIYYASNTTHDPEKLTLRHWQD